MKQGTCGVYKLYKLGKGTGNTFSHDFKKLERDLHVVTHDYADLINRNSKINGSLYEYDEKADKLYWQKKPYKTAEVFAETVPFEEVIDVIDIPITSDEDRRANLANDYLVLSGQKVHHLWKADKIAEKIEELKK